MMPADARRGRRWSDHRKVLNGILFRIRAGCPWRDLPPEYGNWKTAYNRHRRWALDGTWEKILGRLRAGCDEAEGEDWTVSADSTVVRAPVRRCRPVTRILTPGQHGDCPQFIPLMQGVRIARRGMGRPRTRPGRAMADKAYAAARGRIVR